MGQLISTTVGGSVERSDIRDVAGLRPLSPDGVQMSVVAQSAGPHETGTSPVPSQDCQLVVYVQSGTMRLVLDGQSWELHEGDTLDAGGSESVQWHTNERGATAIWASAPLIEEQHIAVRGATRDVP